MPMQQDVILDCLASGGEMGTRARAIDWSRTPLGGVETWSSALSNTVRRLLASRHPLLLWWGPHYIQIYNDALWSILGPRHPEVLGQPAAECWAESWQELGPLVDTPFHGGPATWSRDVVLGMEDFDFDFGDEPHYTIACQPVPDEDTPRGIGGVLATLQLEDRLPLRNAPSLPRLGDARWAVKPEPTWIPPAGELFASFETLPVLANLKQHRVLPLSESAERYRRLVDQLPVAMCTSDADGIMTFYNARASEIWGWSPRLGDRSQRFCGAAQLAWPDGTALAHDQTPMAQALRDGTTSRNRELVMVQPGGRRIHVLVNIDPLHDEAGRIVGAINVFSDVTSLAQAQTELRRDKEAAEAANRAKDAFLANVSHEMRTPFGGILGMTELVLETPLTDDQRQCLTTVKSATVSLLGLIDGLLDYSKIEAGKLELDPAEFSLRAVLNETMRTLLARAEEKGLALDGLVQQGVPDALVGDAGRLRQVLLNLVGNAIKFTKQGRVDVRVEPLARVEVRGEHEPTGDIVLQFAVTDTGIGIPPDGQERIFQAFEQEDSSTTRQYGGTGLGLTIAAGLVGLMGGTIQVESEPGRGSTFVFTARFGMRSHDWGAIVPNPNASSPTRVSHSGPDDSGPVPAPARVPLRILIAEDSEFNSRHLVRLLGRRGHRVWLANDGREALELLGIEGQATSPPSPSLEFDLLLLDLYMPNLDGFQVIQVIREREKHGQGRLPVIALTARAGQEDRDHCLAAGMDAHISKPVRAEELFAMIERLVGAHDNI